jgi:hypothetical protein
MSRPVVTLFTWGYEGWGNWTDKLVEATEAVERSRGWGPPLFVDIRASRKVRAEGFREHAFERRFGADRYRWMNRLGNKAILTHEEYGTLIDPSCAVELLDLAVEFQRKRRRVIYFCSCVSPTSGCHRHWVAPHILKLSEDRKQAVTVVEWPGFESEPRTPPQIRTTPAIVKSVNNGRATVPLGSQTPSPDILGLPWHTLVDLVDSRTGAKLDFILSGPAEHRAGGWQVPVMGGVEDVRETLKLQQEYRAEHMVLPVSWPSASGASARGREGAAR